MDTSTKRVFKFIFITLFVDLLAFTLILPLLPKILDYYASNDKSGLYNLFNENVRVLQDILNVPESHNRVLLAGILGSWFSMLQFISSPVLGALSDKYGRKPVLILSMIGSVLSYTIWYASNDNFGLFIISRTVGGLSKANVGLSLAVISDVSNDDTRGKGMAVVGSSFSLAFITGPLLGAYFASGPQTSTHEELSKSPALIAIFISTISLLLVFFFLEETNPRKLKTSNRIAQRDKTEKLTTSISHFVNPCSLFNFTLVRDKTHQEGAIMKRIGFIYFYYLLLYSGLEFTLSFLTHLRFGFTSMDQGKLYLFSGLIMAMIQGGYIRRMKSGKESLMALVGLFVIVPSFVVMGLANQVTHIYFSLILYAFSSAVVVPCLTTIISSSCPPTEKGATMGTLRSLGALARALGPFISSFMFWTLGSEYCYLVGATALILPVSLMFKFHSCYKGARAERAIKDKSNKIILAKPS